MNSLTTRVLAAVAAAAPLWAQERSQLPPFRFDLAFAGGRQEHHTDQSLLDGDASAAYLRFAFEGISDSGVGGGLRFEAMGSEDDMFTDAGFPATEASSASLFGHLTFRAEGKNLVMPVRVGFQLHGYGIEETASGNRVDFSSFGPMFEVEPELLLRRDGNIIWSLYTQLGFGISATSIDIDTVANGLESSSFHYGLELGTRLYASHVVFGLGVVVRGQHVDTSDVENGNFAFGIEQDFTGLLLSIGAVF